MSGRRIAQTPLVIIVPWTLACVVAAAVVSGLNLPVIGNLLSGSTLVFGIVIAFGPLLIYLGLQRPLGLPFTLYAFLAEFDHLFPPGPMGAVAKFGGILVIAILIVKLLQTGRLIPPGRELLGWFLFLGWAGISMLWSYEPGMGLIELQQLFGLYIFYAIIAVTVSDQTDMRLAIFGVIAAGIALGLFELSSYGAHVSASAGGGELRATLTNGARKNYIDPNHIAASLQIPFVLLLVTMFRERQLPLKLLYLLGCAVIAAAMLATGSRAGTIGAGIIFFYLLFRSRYRLQLAFIGVSAFSLSLLIPTVWTRFGDQTSGAFGGRIPIWKVEFAAFKMHWLAGHGAGTLLSAYTTALRKSFEPAGFFYRSIESHNIFVGTGVEFGLIGIVLLAVAWWFQFGALKQIPPGDPFYDLRLALEAGVISLFVEAFTLDMLTFKYLWIAFSLTELVRATWHRRAPLVRNDLGTQPQILSASSRSR